MTDELKMLIGVGVASLVIIGGGVFLASKNMAVNPTFTGSNTVSIDKNLLIKESSNKTSEVSDKKVSIVVFGDFQCPACAATDPLLKSILDKNNEKVVLIFRHFPLTQHINARPAAYAAEAAGKQGKFWQMHDTLYTNQTQWETLQNPNEKFVEYAQDIGLNMDEYNKTISDPEIKQKVDSDLDDGTKLRVDATPTIFVDGERVVNINNLEKIVSDKIKNLPN